MKLPRPKLTRQEWFSLLSFLGIVLVVCGCIAWVSYELKDLKNQINKPQTVYLPKDGRNGVDGVTTIITKNIEIPAPKAKDGEKGDKGDSVTPEQIAAAVDEYFKQHPVKDGKDGTDGQDGYIIYLRVNPLTQLPECLIKGTLMWQSLEECR